jgi:hypothetical protein
MTYVDYVWLVSPEFSGCDDSDSLPSERLQYSRAARKWWRGEGGTRKYVVGDLVRDKPFG